MPPPPVDDLGERVPGHVMNDAPGLRVVAEHVTPTWAQPGEVHPVESLGHEEVVLAQQREQLVGTQPRDPAAGRHGIQVLLGERPVEPVEEGDVRRGQATDDHPAGLTADAQLDAVGATAQWTKVRLEPGAGCHRRDLLGLTD